MTKAVAAIVVMVMAMPLSARAVGAGVLITQESVAKTGGGAVTEQRTVMIEGHKQKVAGSHQTLITDLDQGLMILLISADKTYTQLPFPPRGAPASAMKGGRELNLTFKKTGKHQTVKGYQCDEYVGSGHSIIGEYSLTGCFSTAAPGAADYIAYQKQFALKVKGTPIESAGVPDGVPLILNTTTKTQFGGIPGLTPEQAKILAQRTPTAEIIRVISIKSASFSPDTFTVPPGYTKRSRPAPMGMPGTPTPLPKIPE